MHDIAKARGGPRAHLGVLVAVAALALPGCKKHHAGSLRCDPASGLAHCAADADSFECTWGRLVRGGGELDSLAGVVLGQPGDVDTLLRLLFPAIGGKPIVDAPLPVPPGLQVRTRSFPDYTIPVPVDWKADPFGNNTWRMRFQTFHWFYEYTRTDPANVDAGAALLVDWVDHALHAEPPLEFSWGDAMSIRAERARELLDRYIATRPVLNRRFLMAAAELLLTHIYAITCETCYADHHNHGMMQDLALLRQLPTYPALRDGARITRLVERRLIDIQVLPRITPDGLHVENTAGYHLLFLHLLTDAIGLYVDRDATPPAELVEARDRMLVPLVYLLQPDFTFPQFGDEDNATRRTRLGQLAARIRAQGVGDPAARTALEWAASGGRTGTPPAALDRVFARSGYASFRDQWSLRRGVGTTAHFKTGRWSTAHYHADETAFEIYAHGMPLIVEPGMHSYDQADPLWAYQREPAGHNILVVDGDTTVPGVLSGASRVVDHGGAGDQVWVQGTHTRYQHLGVSSLVRTFAYVKPDVFAVVDHLHADAGHRLAQHFHLHPDLDRLEVVDARTVVVRTADGPSIALIAAVEPTAIETPRGLASGRDRQGWYFPAFNQALAAYDVIFRYDHAAADVDLPVLIMVFAPGVTPRLPSAVTYRETGDQASMGWRVGSVARELHFPAR